MTTAKKTRCFFSDTPLTHEGQLIVLQPDETRHIQLTLRLEPGSDVRVTDGLGHEALAAITSFEADHTTRLTLTRILQTPSPAEGSRLTLRLFAAFAAKGVMDELIEKGQELGVASFHPLMTERTVVSLAAEKEGKVLERWYKISREAAKQSGNAALIQIARPITLEAALKMIPPGEDILFFHPGPSSRAFEEWLRDSRPKSGQASVLNLFIGPEGGFSDREVLKAREASGLYGIRMTLISLGKSILRVSTAVVAAVAALKYSQR